MHHRYFDDIHMPANASACKCWRIERWDGPSALLLPNFREENQRDRLDRETELIKQKITQIRTLINAPDNGIDLELFLVMLCQEYEEFLKNNPEEFKYMNKTSIEALKDFYKTVNARPIVFQSFWLCGSPQTVENSSRDGNTRPAYRPAEKSVCRSRGNT